MGDRATINMGRNLGEAVLFWGEMGPHLTQCCRAKTYVHAKFHLDPSNRLATVHEHYRQTGQHRKDTETHNGPIG